MRIRAVTVLLSLGLPLVAGSAASAPVAVTASLRLQLGGYFDPFVVTGTGVVDVSGGVYSIPAGLVALASATIPVTGSTNINSLIVTGIGNLAGTFSLGGVTAQAPAEICLAPANGEACVSGGGIGGIVPLAGSIQVHVIPNLVVIPIQISDLRLGEGGSTNVPYTVDGAPWTTGTAMVRSTFGGTVSTMGSAGGGGLTLVSAAFFSACGNLLPVTARLSLTPLVPEPAGLALIAFGVAGLAAVARRRR